MYLDRTEVEGSIEKIKAHLANKPDTASIPWFFASIAKLCEDWINKDDEINDLKAELVEKEDEVNGVTEEADMYSSEVEELKETITTQETQIAELTAQVSSLEEVEAEQNESADGLGLGLTPEQLANAEGCN